MSERIVVGVDGSPGSRIALRWAVAEARRRSAQVGAVMSWQLPAAGRGAVVRLAPPMPDLAAEAGDQLQLVLRDEGLGDSDDPAVSPTVVEGSPAAVLIDTAQGADLLVVGTRGLDEARGMLLARSGCACVTHAPCPVVVVPAETTTG